MHFNSVYLVYFYEQVIKLHSANQFIGEIWNLGDYIHYLECGF